MVFRCISPPIHRTAFPSCRTCYHIWKSVRSFSAEPFLSIAILANFLHQVLEMKASHRSLMLMVFGLARMFGNWMAGMALDKGLYNSLLIFIISNIAIFLLLQFPGSGFLFQVVVMFGRGFLHMAGFVLYQAWVFSVGSEAPEFAHSLLVSTGNLRVALGAYFGSLIVAHVGI